jgi:hypothetical protein
MGCYSRACGYKRSGILFWLDSMVWMGMVWFCSRLGGLVCSIEPFVDHTLRLIQHNWVVLAYNFNVVMLALIIGESSISVIFAYHFITVLSLLLPRIIILFLRLQSTNISVLNLTIFPCYSNLLLRRTRWTGILRWWVLGYVLPRLPFLWSYGVFCCSVPLRVIMVFRDITYVIIMHYSWHLVISKHFCAVCVDQLILGHAYDQYLVLA